MRGFTRNGSCRASETGEGLLRVFYGLLSLRYRGGGVVSTQAKLQLINIGRHPTRVVEKSVRIAAGNEIDGGTPATSCPLIYICLCPAYIGYLYHPRSTDLVLLPLHPHVGCLPCGVSAVSDSLLLHLTTASTKGVCPSV